MLSEDVEEAEHGKREDREENRAPGPDVVATTSQILVALAR